MSHPNPLLPPGSSLEDRKQRKTKILVTVCGIVALHVIPISGLLLMQGCKPDLSKIATTTETTPNQEVPMLNTNQLYREFESDDPRLSIPIETETPPYELAGQDLEPTISTEVILDEPGVGEVSDNQRSPVGGGGVEPNEGLVVSQELNTVAVQPEVVTPPSQPASLSLDYKIEPGDRLYSLAKEYSTTVDAILGANPGLDPRKLRVGQSIVIPRNSISVAAAARETEPSLGQGSNQKVYEVKRGDTLTRIARQNGITLSSLRKANGLNSDRILVGQSLQIPVAEVASVKPQ